MKFHRRLAAVLCCAVFLCGCAAPDSPPPPETAPAASPPAAVTTLAVGWAAGCANPYQNSSTLTAQLAQLVFEPMVRISPDFEPEYRLAQAVSSTGTAAVITPRPGCAFADGAPVTAEDLAASLLAAKASALYGRRFDNVQAVEAVDGRVLVTLATPDSLFAYLLDIPVMKAAETAEAMPTPCGRYRYGADGESLVPNPSAPFPEPMPDIITLTAISNYSGLVSGLATGELDLYVAADTNMVKTFTSTSLPFKSNTMIFLGVNCYAANPLCSTAAGRCALNALIDRHELSDRCYDTHAYPATGILNSFYPCVRGQQVLAADADAALADQLLAQLGYTQNDAGQYLTAGRAPATLRLLTAPGNSYRRYAAQCLVEKWNAAGLRAELVETKTFDEFLSCVQNHQFELYIGEMKLYNNMDISAFWQYGLGLTASDSLRAACGTFRQDAAAAPLLEAAFAAEMPFIPLLWENGAVIAGRNAADLVPSVSGPFYRLRRE